MKLWTWQTSNFSLLTGRVDHSRSEYFQTVAKVPEAYEQLFKKLGTDQLIWCYTLPDQYEVTATNNRVEWVLDIPESRILGFVDSIVWNRILGIRCWSPMELRRKWKFEALNKYPDNSKSRDQYIEGKENAFWNQCPPNGTWWDSLFVAQCAAENVSALIPHPVKRDWVTTCPLEKSCS